MGSLTSENGKLCIDGAVLEPDADSNMIYWPEGNYYLAENVTVANAIEIRGVVNLCLNGHTLNTGEKCIDVRKTTNGTAMGNLSLCDCGEGGTITGEFCGASNSYALISVGNEFSMYGGKVINAGDNNQQYSQAVSAFGGTVKLFGGEIVSLDDNAFFVGGSTGGLHLSGAPKIKGAANRVDIYLKNGYYDKTITLDAPITNTEPYRVAAEGENVFTSGWNTHMSGKDFSDYFISATKGRFIAKDENNELKIYDYAITEQPSAANSYTITANGAPDYAPASYKWYSATVKTENVTNENAQTTIHPSDGTITSSYDSETDIWTGVYSPPMKRFTLKFTYMRGIRLRLSRPLLMVFGAQKLKMTNMTTTFMKAQPMMRASMSLPPKAALLIRLV